MELSILSFSAHGRKEREKKMKKGGEDRDAKYLQERFLPLSSPDRKSRGEGKRGKRAEKICFPVALACAFLPLRGGTT